jgi:hypothetical protein
MSRDEAVNWMLQGGKVRHATWSMDLYAYYEGGCFYYSDGFFAGSLPDILFFSDDWQVFTKDILFLPDNWHVFTK